MISLRIRLFADDCLLYREVNCTQDKDCLQADLDALQKWAESWQMRINATKCYLLPMHRKGDQNINSYNLKNYILEAVEHNPYLGVELQGNLKWDQHVGNVTAKANRSLGFIRSNLCMCPQEIKTTALLRSHLEYAAAAWNPHLVKDIQTLEAVQRRAARFVTNNTSRIPGSMTKILDDLNWSFLEKRRKIQRQNTNIRQVNVSVILLVT